VSCVVVAGLVLSGNEHHGCEVVFLPAMPEFHLHREEVERDFPEYSSGTAAVTPLSPPCRLNELCNVHTSTFPARGVHDNTVSCMEHQLTPRGTLLAEETYGWNQCSFMYISLTVEPSKANVTRGLAVLQNTI